MVAANDPATQVMRVQPEPVAFLTGEKELSHGALLGSIEKLADKKSKEYYKKMLDAEVKKLSQMNQAHMNDVWFLYNYQNANLRAIDKTTGQPLTAAATVEALPDGIQPLFSGESAVNDADINAPREPINTSLGLSDQHSNASVYNSLGLTPEQASAEGNITVPSEEAVLLNAALDWSQQDEYYAAHLKDGAKLGDIDDVLETNQALRKSWLKASKLVYEMEHGKPPPAKWSDERIIEEGLDYIREFNNILAPLDGGFLWTNGGMFGIKRAVDKATPEQTVAFGYLMDTLDKSDFFNIHGFKEGVQDAAQDWSTYGSIASLGWGAAGRKAAMEGGKHLLKAELRDSIKKIFFEKGLKSQILRSTAIMAPEAALFSVAADYNRQGANIKLDRQQAHDMDQTVEAAVSGALVGTVFGVGVPVVGQKVMPALQANSVYITTGTKNIYNKIAGNPIKKTAAEAKTESKNVFAEAKKALDPQNKKKTEEAKAEKEATPDETADATPEASRPSGQAQATNNATVDGRASPAPEEGIHANTGQQAQPDDIVSNNNGNVFDINEARKRKQTGTQDNTQSGPTPNGSATTSNNHTTGFNSASGTGSNNSGAPNGPTPQPKPGGGTRSLEYYKNKYSEIAQPDVKSFPKFEPKLDKYKVLAHFGVSQYYLPKIRLFSVKAMRARCYEVVRPVISSVDTVMMEGGVSPAIQKMHQDIIALSYKAKDQASMKLDITNKLDEFADQNAKKMLEAHEHVKQLRQHVYESYKTNTQEVRKNSTNNQPKSKITGKELETTKDVTRWTHDLTVAQKEELLKYLDHQQTVLEDLMKGSASKNAKEVFENAELIRTHKMKVEYVEQSIFGLSKAHEMAMHNEIRHTGYEPGSLPFLDENGKAITKGKFRLNDTIYRKRQDPDNPGEEARRVAEHVLRKLEHQINLVCYDKTSYAQNPMKAVNPMTWAYTKKHNLESHYLNRILHRMLERDENGKLKIDYATGSTQAPPNFVGAMSTLIENGFGEHAVLFTQIAARYAQPDGTGGMNTPLPNREQYTLNLKNTHAIDLNPVIDGTRSIDDLNYNTFWHNQVVKNIRQDYFASGKASLVTIAGVKERFFMDNRKANAKAERGIEYWEAGHQWADSSMEPSWYTFGITPSAPMRIEKDIAKKFLVYKAGAYFGGFKQYEPGKSHHLVASEDDLEKAVYKWYDKEGGENAFHAGRRIVVRGLTGGLVSDVHASILPWKAVELSKPGYIALGGAALYGVASIPENDIETLQWIGEIPVDIALNTGSVLAAIPTIAATGVYSQLTGQNWEFHDETIELEDLNIFADINNLDNFGKKFRVDSVTTLPGYFDKKWENVSEDKLTYNEALEIVENDTAYRTLPEYNRKQIAKLMAARDIDDINLLRKNHLDELTAARNATPSTEEQSPPQTPAQNQQNQDTGAPQTQGGQPSGSPASSPTFTTNPNAAPVVGGDPNASNKGGKDAGFDFGDAASRGWDGLTNHLPTKNSEGMNTFKAGAGSVFGAIGNFWDDLGQNKVDVPIFQNSKDLRDLLVSAMIMFLPAKWASNKTGTGGLGFVAAMVVGSLLISKFFGNEHQGKGTHTPKSKGDNKPTQSSGQQPAASQESGGNGQQPPAAPSEETFTRTRPKDKLIYDNDSNLKGKYSLIASDTNTNDKYDTIFLVNQGSNNLVKYEALKKAAAHAAFQAKNFAEIPEFALKEARVNAETMDVDVIDVGGKLGKVVMFKDTTGANDPQYLMADIAG